ncbi:BapA/Bap/LapF family large adhesin [Pseudomonas sp. ADAK13]|uniref:BapA/Bap/LapF family large adhesin n=1 Tax=Pseudomonas sp. ADAK13 TaxID=2730847 RepID=UPI001F456E5D|nr:BapA/Bap/LapF family large adhesin [Pseudomonas sp. ADAK13]
MRVFTLLGIGGIILGDHTKQQEFSVAEGSSGTLNLQFAQADLVSLLGGGFTATLEVSDGAGGWLPVQQGSNGSGLLDLLGLFGQSSSAKIEGLEAGQYRFTLKLDPNLVSVGAGATAKLSVTNESLTDFTGVAGPDVTGNVITDPGIGGQPDEPGTGGPVKVQVEVEGEFVDADATTGTVLQGQYGQLTIFANGDYKYTPNGDIANIGKVDAFEYHLVNGSGGSASATLYVRIDSPSVDVEWSATDPSAPGVINTVANDDLGSAQIDIVNLVTQADLATLSYNLALLGSSTGTGAAINVGTGTTAELAINVTVTGIALLPGTTVNLQKFIDNAWVTQQTTTQANYTFKGLDAGTYRVTGTTGAVLSLSALHIAQKLTTTFLTEFVTGAMENATGNLLSDSLSGPDVLGSPLTVLSVLVNGVYVIPGQTGANINGDHGTLTVFADGKYVYTPHAGLTLDEIGQVDKFTYKLTTPTGQEDTADLYIRIDSPDRDLVWDDTNPGAPATEGAGIAAAHSAVDQVVDDGANVDGDHHDAVVADDTDFTHVDAGAGADGLLWEGGDAAINLTDLIGTVSGVHSIDLNDVSAVDLTLSLEDLVSITGPESDRLMIQGDDQDSVHLTGDWSAGATQVENGLEYVIYTSAEDETHQLWVQSGISVV